VTYWLTLTPTYCKGDSCKDSRKSAASTEQSAMHDSSVSAFSSASVRTSSTHLAASGMDERKKRLIAWNVDLLAKSLRKIMAMRSIDKVNRSSVNEDLVNNLQIFEATVLDEVKEIITLPQEEMNYKRESDSIVIDSSTEAQLRDFVTLIASMYRDNSFHNFEHASHVTQSVSKLMSRIVTSDDIDYKDLQYKKKSSVSQLHKYTFGITSDPITQFACTFSALIHDVDHPGLPNATLVKEGTDIAKLYDYKSVAEQNSVELAWNLLMEDQFQELRALIYTNQEELVRFRQLVVNAVMATDIADKELAELRRDRWDKAFHGDEELGQDSRSSLFEEDPSASTFNISPSVSEESNRKATIVIEHLIQASDVAHTMQHWHVYIKWNEKLFHEMYRAYEEGRADNDPSEGWYQGELGFFDFYIIPLAKKLKECGVFGVSSDEYLNYAEANRHEWELKGREVVDAYMQMYKGRESVDADVKVYKRKDTIPRPSSSPRKFLRRLSNGA
jgi:hypothetical protein